MNITYHVLAIETYLGPINFIIFCIFSDLCTESKKVEMAVFQDPRLPVISLMENSVHLHNS